MFPILTKVIVILSLSLWISACTDKDREMAKRESDGADTFKFKGPPAPSATPLGPVASTPSMKPKLDKKSDSDGTDTFKFKQDTRYFPKQKNATGK